MRNRIVLSIVGLILLALCLAWISSGFASFHGVVSFLGVLLVGIGLLWGGWQALQTEKLPPWLGWLLIGATLLRLVIGIFWYIGLPEWG